MVSSNGSALANPFEFRELMAASVGYDERTVEQVQAAHQARARERERERRQPGMKAGKRNPKLLAKAPEVTDPNSIPRETLNALEQLRTQGRRPS